MYVLPPPSCPPPPHRLTHSHRIDIDQLGRVSRLPVAVQGDGDVGALVHGEVMPQPLQPQRARLGQLVVVVGEHHSLG